jgi:hypothetical protein
MPEGTSFANLIRDKPDAGLLPRVLPEKIVDWRRPGLPCYGCGEPVHPAPIEYEFLLGGHVFRLHIGCVRMWLAELRRRGLVSSP